MYAIVYILETEPAKTVRVAPPDNGAQRCSSTRLCYRRPSFGVRRGQGALAV